jgi:PRTRC genetic system protein A
MLIDTLKLDNVGQLLQRPDCFYQEVLAANGKFRRAWRPGLDVLIPEDLKYGGYPQGANASAYIHLIKRVPLMLFSGALALFQPAMPREALVWYACDPESINCYSLVLPVQTANEGMVVPVDRYHPALEHVLVDLHSHNSMPAFFSSKDDRDEENGFRIYAVVGHLNTTPQIKVRVGVFGCWMVVRPSLVFELPEGIEELL